MDFFPPEIDREGMGKLLSKFGGPEVEGIEDWIEGMADVLGKLEDGFEGDLESRMISALDSRISRDPGLDVEGYTKFLEGEAEGLRSRWRGEIDSIVEVAYDKWYERNRGAIDKWLGSWEGVSRLFERIGERWRRGIDSEIARGERAWEEAREEVGRLHKEWSDLFEAKVLEGERLWDEVLLHLRGAREEWRALVEGQMREGREEWEELFRVLLRNRGIAEATMQDVVSQEREEWLTYTEQLKGILLTEDMDFEGLAERYRGLAGEYRRLAQSARESEGNPPKVGGGSPNVVVRVDGEFEELPSSGVEGYYGDPEAYLRMAEDYESRARQMDEYSEDLVKLRDETINYLAVRVGSSMMDLMVRGALRSYINSVRDVEEEEGEFKEYLEGEARFRPQGCCYVSLSPFSRRR
ncbi:MAG: hypothetical protein ACUVXI_17665 [bacterium]